MRNRSTPPTHWWALPPIDALVPHPARRCDFRLGGKGNFAADRESARDIENILPTIALAARANRSFMHRVVRHHTRHGIRQFLDIGTGIPTATRPSGGEVARHAVPDTRIVHIDNDRPALSHARALLTSNPNGATAYIDAHLRQPHTMLNHRTLDPTEPVGLLIAVLHFLAEHDVPYGVVTELVNALPAGGFVAITHVRTDLLPSDVAARTEPNDATSGVDTTFRTRHQFARFFTGLHPVQPGIVPVITWCPDQADDRLHPDHSAVCAAGAGTPTADTALRTQATHRQRPDHPVPRSTPLCPAGTPPSRPGQQPAGGTDAGRDGGDRPAVTSADGDNIDLYRDLGSGAAMVITLRRHLDQVDSIVDAIPEERFRARLHQVLTANGYQACPPVGPFAHPDTAGVAHHRSPGGVGSGTTEGHHHLRAGGDRHPRMGAGIRDAHCDATIDRHRTGVLAATGPDTRCQKLPPPRRWSAPTVGAQRSAAAAPGPQQRPRRTAVDPDHPDPARVWDALLGGAANYAADRAMARRLSVAEPRFGHWAAAHRYFTHRAVRHLYAVGVRQFLDLGCGLPTITSTYDALHTGMPAHPRHNVVLPDIRVAYVDVDPVVLGYLHRRHHGDRRVATIHADLRHPHTVTDHPNLRRVLNLTQPVAILAVAVLQHLPDDEPATLLSHLRNAAAPGSYLAISHPGPPPGSNRELTPAMEHYRTHVAPWHPRAPEHAAHLCEAWSITDPGVTPVGTWSATGDDRNPPDTPPFDPAPDWACLAIAEAR